MLDILQKSKVWIIKIAYINVLSLFFISDFLPRSPFRLLNFCFIWPDKVVRLPESQLEAHKGSVTINQADGGGINDIRTVRVEAPTRSGLPEEFGTIQDPHGRICANLKEVTGNHSIEYKGVRAKISTLETMGVVARDANGELMILGDDG